jgi:small subunit ribosomal protein S7
MNNKQIIAKFTNLIMRDGKKSIASKLLYTSLKLASTKLDMTLEEVLTKSLANIKPLIDARSKKVGRTTYMIPYAITEEQSVKLALKIFVNSARERKERTFTDRLTNEFIDAIHNKGGSIKKKNEIHKLAEANKSYAFFR